MNRKTVVRKQLFLETQARASHKKLLASYEKSPVMDVQFDEMESFEHTKCKPLSIPLVIDPKSRKILGFAVCSMPAKGPLAQIARHKYGYRPDHRAQAAQELFESLKTVISTKAVILSDQNPKYPAWIKRHFPYATHKTVKGQRGCVVGQGELKAVAFDPLFSLNHTCAMIRANVNRLVRRTWCTTKRMDRLAAHIALYVQYHNDTLTSHKVRASPP